MTQSEFFELLDSSEPGREYLRIVNATRNRKIQGKPVEHHHVHPKGLGGNRVSLNNIVNLTTYEHCLVHVLLARAIPCSATYKPIIRMSSQFTKLLSPEQITLEEIYKWSELREKALHASHSPEHSAAISQARKGQRCNNADTIWMHKENRNTRVKFENIEQMKEDGWLEGRSEQTHFNIHKAREGQPGTRLGTHQSQQTREKIRQQKLGAVWVNNGTECKAIFKDPDQDKILQDYLDKGWVRGRKLQGIQ